MDRLRWQVGARGRKLIAEPTDEIGGAIRAGHRIAGLGHCFRPGKRTINLNGLGQTDVQEGGAIGPGFFGFLAEDLADVFHLCPGGFAAPKLGVDLSPGRQFNGSLVEDAAGPDDASIRAEDVSVGGVFIQVPGLAGVPSKLIATLGKVGRYHFCHLVPAHFLHPTGMSGSLKRTPLLIATEHWRKGEFVTVGVGLAEAVGPVVQGEHQGTTALDADPLGVIEVRAATGDPGGHRLHGPVPVIVQLFHQGQRIELHRLLRQQVGDSGEESPDGMRHAMKTTADFPDQAVAMKIATATERSDGPGPHDPGVDVRLGDTHLVSPEFRIVVRRTNRPLVRQVARSEPENPGLLG